MKTEVRTPKGKKVTWRDATLPVGAALRIVPSFVATATDDDLPIETTIEAVYTPDAGRYLIVASHHQAREPSGEITGDVIRRVRFAEILSSAAPDCIVVDFEGRPVPASRLSATSGRLLPRPLAQTLGAATRVTDATLDAVQLVYGVAALSGSSPAQALIDEFGISKRKATYWIKLARTAGRLEGVKYALGRPADG